MTAIRAEPIIITGHTCLAAIPHVEIDGTLYLETFTKVGDPARLFPAETGERLESVMTTLNSCLTTEVADKPSGFSWELMMGEHVFAMLGRDDLNQGDRTRRHAKLCYLVETKGELRRGRHQPDGRDTLTGVGRWEIQRLIDHMLRVRTPWMHIMSARATLLVMAHRNLEVFDRYTKLYNLCIDELEKRNFPDEEKEALRQYLSRRLR